MSDTPYFRLFPSDFLNGIGGLDADQIAAYTVVLMLIYDRQEPIPEDIDGWAWRLRMRRDRCRRAVDSLVEMGKLERGETGLLFNRRAGKEIDYRQRMSRKQSDNAHDRWSKSEQKANKNKDDAMPAQCHRNAIPESRVHSPQSIVQNEPPNGGSSAQTELIPPEARLPATTGLSPSRKTGKRLAREESAWPDGFELDGDLHRYAEDAGIPFQEIPALWERFKNHHQAKGTRFKDWRAAWRTWVGNEIKFSRGRANAAGRPERAAYDPIEVARRQIAQFTKLEEEDGTLWPKTAN